LINTRGKPPDAADEARLRDVGREFGALSVLYEDDPGFDRDLATIRLLGGDYDGAATALETCLLLDPRRPSATFLLALARLGQGRSADARALLERVGASDPSYAAAQRRLQQLGR
jgi:tetratricopeptide (TPR) repeat protein